MVRVVEAISDTNIGGAGILLLNRLTHTNKKLFDTTVLLPQNSQLAERFEEIGVKTVEISGGGDRSFDPAGMIKYTSALKKIRPHIINSHGSLTSRIAATATGVPVRIYTRHCVFPLNGLYRYSAVRAAVGALTDILSHKVIAVAYSAKKDLVKMGVRSEKIKVIINGAMPLNKTSKQESERLKKEMGISPKDTVVTICARLEKCKDHICFLKAAKILTENGGDHKFLIIGSGSLEHSLKQMSHGLGLDGRVIFTGFIKDISPYMSITDINVNCSIGTETSSLALSEGMSLGIPAVVSNYGGNPYMVKNRVNGYVYKAGDPRDLARCIQMIAKAKGRDIYERMSKASRKRFETELNSERMTRETERLYIELLKEKDRSKRPRSGYFLNQRCN